VKHLIENHFATELIEKCNKNNCHS